MTTVVSIAIRASATAAISAFNQVRAAGASLGANLGSIGAKMSEVGQAGTLLTAPIIAGLAGAAKVASDFRSEMSGASRALDSTKQETAAFSEEILTLAPPLGMLPTEFAKLATEAGKLGVAKADIKDFSVLISEVHAATDANSTALAQYGATIRTVYGLGTDELRNYFAAVNALDDKIGGSTETMSDFVNRTAAVGKLAGVTAKELAAMGSTYLSVGISSERAATASNTMIGKLLAVNTLSDGAKASVEAMGFSVDGLQQKMAKGGQQGITEFLDRLQTFSPSKQLELATSIFGRESADEILTLVAAMDKYKSALGVIGNDTGNVAKLQAELEKKLASSNAVFLASLQAMGISIGSAIVPALNNILKAITPVVNAIAGFARANPAITTTVVAIVGLTAVMFPLLAIVGSAITAITTITAAFSSLSLSFGFVTVALKLVAAGFTALLSPIGLAIAAAVAVGATAGWVIANWDRVSPALNRVWSSVTAGASAAWNFMVSGASNTVKRITDVFLFLPRMAFNAGQALGSSFANGIESMISKATSAVGKMTSAVRRFLPFSPAKEGALRDLDQVDIVGTIAKNIDARPLTGGLNSALSEGKSVIGSGGGIGGGGANTGGTVVYITNSPEVTINGNVPREQVLDVLRDNNRELVTIFDQAINKTRRTQFA